RIGLNDQCLRAAGLIVGNVKRGNRWRYEWKPQRVGGVACEREGTCEVTLVDAVRSECARKGVAVDNIREEGAVLTIIGCSCEIGGAIARESTRRMHFIRRSRRGR